MERDLVRPKIKRGLYPLVLSTIIALSSLACGIRQGQSFSPDIPITPTATPLEPDLQRFMNSDPSFKEIYEKARARNYGVVLLWPENVSSDTWIRFQRMDLSASERSEVDLETIKITPDQKIYQIFLATSCSGEYQLSVSLDGENYSHLPLPDIKTGISKDTFFLRPSCLRPVTLSFEKPDRT